ncbi:DUF4435 domain-containing protein [Pseudoalteromonas sp. KAN5]|uniref:DUF4435 domain-containing protein n=1 Tax=Pseudoalteromonas sp. KAN5 TaxID=2916633 RepID=UPI001FCC980C|nr:DUF4435 domain-containing protein [Pseudoalteromonas sp. KAN5]BDF93702.1 hypothetical protein KAN5_05400 [Pseudoalteromonas sp. KAN5]
MDRVTSMQEQGGSHSVKFLEFTRIHSKFKDNLICVFEGQDEKYFAPRINLKIGENRWNGINSGGRKVVLDLYELISVHHIYRNANYRCFIDKDFQYSFVNPEPEKIYVTNGYSIENNYVNESVFKRVLACEFNVTEFNENSGDYTKCVEAFNNRFHEHNNAIHKFNCWVKAHRLMEYRGEAPRTLNVQGIKISSLIDVSISEVKRIYTDKPQDLFKDYDNLLLCSKAVNEADETLTSTNVVNAYRGKQQLEFFRLFLTKLREDRVSASPTLFSKKARVSLNLSKDNCISELSQYADVPECLNRFLDITAQQLAA